MKKSRTRVRRIKTAATHLVRRARRASKVLALFLAKNVSPLPPPMAPDRPELFPLWNKTMATRATQAIS